MVTVSAALPATYCVAVPQDVDVICAGAIAQTVTDPPAYDADALPASTTREVKIPCTGGDVAGAEGPRMAVVTVNVVEKPGGSPVPVPDVH